MNKHYELDLKNRELYKKKNLLKLIYNNYFNLIKQNLKKNKNLQTLEIGSSGFIKEIIPECVTSNLEKKDNIIDVQENIYELSQKDNSLSNIIMVDIFHHLEFPRLALNNMYRTLEHGGRVIMVEPSMGLIPRIVYKLFHHEPNGFNFRINWEKIPDELFDQSKYFAAQSIPWRAFIKKELNLYNKFTIKKVYQFSDFAYLGSGGFSYRSFYPKKFYNFIKSLDGILTKVSNKIFAARMLIVLEKI
jgi:SAM-dependent methyltransferase